MNKIIVMNIFFGRRPDYFDLFLKSCSANPAVDFLFFVDFDVSYVIPTNVRLIATTLDEIRKRFQANFDFPIMLQSAYKLCDFRPAFGEIFLDYFKNYEWWGHCDFDMVFGDLSPIVAVANSGEYVKVFRRGHLSLYRNTSEINSVYKNRMAGLDYRSFYQQEKFFLFDETNGIDKIFNQLNLPVYREELIADITPKSPFLRMTAHENRLGQSFTWNNGILRCNDLFGSEREFVYIHFQKRKMIEKYKEILDGNFSIVITQFGMHRGSGGVPGIALKLLPLIPNFSQLKRFYVPRVVKTLKRYLAGNRRGL